MFIFQYFAKKHSFTESANIFSIAMLFWSKDRRHDNYRASVSKVSPITVNTIPCWNLSRLFGSNMCAVWGEKNTLPVTHVQKSAISDQFFSHVSIFYLIWPLIDTLYGVLVHGLKRDLFILPNAFLCQQPCKTVGNLSAAIRKSGDTSFDHTSCNRFVSLNWAQ